MAKEISGLIKLQIRGGAANPAPPVGPALGAKGVNIMEFCKQFNARTQDKPGSIVRTADRGIEVGTGGGRIIVTELQPEGKNRMDAKSFLAGNKLVIGEKFNNKPRLEIPS